MRFGPELVLELSSTTLIGDKGYDSDAFVKQLEDQGCSVIIPARAKRKAPRSHDTDSYKHRYLVEVYFQRIKRFRRIATRYEKLAVTFGGMVLIASILLWLR